MQRVIHVIAEQLEALLAFRDILSLSLSSRDARTALQCNAVVQSRWKRRLNASIVGAAIGEYVKAVHTHCCNAAQAAGEVSVPVLQAQLKMEPLSQMRGSEAWLLVAKHVRMYEDAVFSMLEPLKDRAVVAVELRKLQQLCAFLSDHYDADVVQRAIQKCESPIAALVYACILHTRRMRGVRLTAMERAFLAAMASKHANSTVEFCFTAFGNQSTVAGSREKDHLTTMRWPFGQCFAEAIRSATTAGASAVDPFAVWQRHSMLVQPAVGVQPATISVR